jgi:hypothetical protein
LGDRREFRRLIREVDEAHRWFFVAAHEARQLELNLDATRVALAALKGEFATAQEAIAVARTHIAGKGFLHLDAWMDVWSH